MYWLSFEDWAQQESPNTNKPDQPGKRGIKRLRITYTCDKQVECAKQNKPEQQEFMKEE